MMSTQRNSRLGKNLEWQSRMQNPCNISMKLFDE